MFTVKFISFIQDTGAQSETAIECPHYEVYQNNKGDYAITCYKDFTSTDGVERWILNDPNTSDENRPNRYWHVCYVQNEAGKTIATYRPPQPNLVSSNTNGAA